MKARLLKKILNDTKYIVHDYGDKICIGNDFVSDLISVDKKTLQIQYALDGRNGRESLLGKSCSSLLFIWDTLRHLIYTGEMKDIIEGGDVLENPLAVFTCKNGLLIYATTDDYGYPNVTADGILMHDNSYFKTKSKALESGIRDRQSGIDMSEQLLKEREEELQKIKDRIDSYKKDITSYTCLLQIEEQTAERSVATDSE